MLERIKADLKKKYPSDICDALVNSYVNIKEQYYLMKHEPSELSGGKFVEACIRLLQKELTNSYTPIGSHIPNVIDVLRNFENSSKDNNNSFRIHIPRALLIIYNIRNKRGVGHLSGDVNPNFADATIIATVADWVLAEIYSVVFTTPLEEAQEIVNNLVRIKIPLIFEIGEIKRVLDPTISFRDQGLLLLYSSHPTPMTDNELVKCIEYKQPSYYKSYHLSRLHKDRLIEYSKDGNCTLSPTGIRYIEDNYGQWLDNFCKGE